MANLFICGDIVNHSHNLNFVSDTLVKKISEADYSVCNFEGAEIRKGEIVTCPHQESGTTEYLKSIGFDLFLLANNHITELGADGLRNSIEAISAVGADYIGAGLSWNETYRSLSRVIDGKTFGFINVCEAQVGQFLSPIQSFGYAWMGYQNLESDIRALSEKSDYVIVFVHAGLEHYPVPLPEIRNFYKRLCDAGASAIIGGHPHIAQGYEYYNSKLIVYSLGNFYFPRIINNHPEEDISYSVMINFDQCESINITPVHHRLLNGKVELISDNSQCIDLEKLCSMLSNNYESIVEKMCLEAYDHLCSHLLAEASCGEYENISFYENLKLKFRHIFLRNKYVKNTQKRRYSLLLRLFENETYKWTIVRALKIKIYGKKN